MGERHSLLPGALSTTLQLLLTGCHRDEAAAGVTEEPKIHTLPKDPLARQV